MHFRVSNRRLTIWSILITIPKCLLFEKLVFNPNKHNFVVWAHSVSWQLSHICRQWLLPVTLRKSTGVDLLLETWLMFGLCSSSCPNIVSLLNFYILLKERECWKWVVLGEVRAAQELNDHDARWSPALLFYKVA